MSEPSSGAHRRKPHHQSQQQQQQHPSTIIPPSSEPYPSPQENTSPGETVLPIREQTWLDPGTWSASTKFLPAYILLLGLFISIYVFRDDAVANDSGIPPLDLSSYAACTASFDYSFGVNPALDAMRSGAKRALDVGFAAQAALETFDPDLSVFAPGPGPFPGGKVPGLGFGKLRPSLLYVDQRAGFRDGKLWAGEEVGGMEAAAALGVPAVLLSGRRSWAGKGVESVAGWLLEEAPRFANGAVAGGEGTRVSAGSVAGFAPFLAYYAVRKGDVGIAREAVRQIGLHRDLLLVRSGPAKGLWRHVAGPAGVADGGAWATGDALAAWGMTRTRATIAAWTGSNATMAKEIRDLDSWVKEILDAAIRTDDDGSELLRNYLDDKKSSGESSGTSLLAAMAYRMVIANPTVFSPEKYLAWADRKRRSVFSRIGDDGVVRPAIDPVDYRTGSIVEFSAQGQAFLIVLGTAWRDCVCAGICLDTYHQERPASLPVKQTMPWDNMYTYFYAKSASLRAYLGGKLKYFRGPGQ